ncbi:MAG: ribonuclease P protein component [Acholeplasma sp.]|nr:ribonuclease P protein component [Acholeplasma sp.]
MKKIYRIKKKSEIDVLFKEKTKKSNSYFTIYLKKRDDTTNFRFALSIGRKYGNAVERNKIKRQIRSIVRLNKGIIKSDVEFVIVIKPQANGLLFEEINKYILYLLNKLNVLENENEKTK